MLSFLYAVLTKECAVITQAVGFEVFRGVYHAPKYGRPAMALDLCEEFRPLIADSVCLNLFNQGEGGAGGLRQACPRHCADGEPATRRAGWLRVA